MIYKKHTRAQRAVVVVVVVEALKTGNIGNHH
jgi:hypothetical protein